MRKNGRSKLFISCLVVGTFMLQASLALAVTASIDVRALTNSDITTILTGGTGVIITPDALPNPAGYSWSRGLSSATVGTTSINNSSFAAGDYAQSADSLVYNFLPNSGQAAFGSGAPLDPANATANAQATSFNGGTANANSLSSVLLGFSVSGAGTVNYNIDYEMTFGFLFDNANDRAANATGGVYFGLGGVTFDQNGNPIFNELDRYTKTFTKTSDFSYNAYNQSIVDLLNTDPLTGLPLPPTDPNFFTPDELLNSLTGNFNDGSFGYIYAEAWTDATASSVPEPGTFLLLGAGMAGLIAYRRRRVASLS